MNNQILEQLSSHLTGLLYFSESEAPLTVSSLGQVPEGQLKNVIATANQAAPDTLEQVAPENFFAHISRSADPGDALIVSHARRFQELYAFLKANFSILHVFRITGAVKVPVIITASLPDQTTIAISTYAIES